MYEAIKVTDELEFLDPSKVSIARNAFEELVVQLPDGTTHTKVEPVRSFPINETSRYIALLDDEGNEIGIVEDVKKTNISVSRCSYGRAAKTILYAENYQNQLT